MKLKSIVICEKYWVLADQVVVSASAFLTNLLLARALGLSKYGLFSIVAMVQLLLLSVTMAFGAQVYQVVYPKLDDVKKRMLTIGMLSQQLALAAALSALIPVLYLVAAKLNSSWLNTNVSLIAVAIIATALYLLQDFLRRVFMTQGKGKAAFIIDFLTNALQIIALGVFWYLHKINPVTAWFIIGFSFVPSILVGLYLLRPIKLTIEAFRFCWSQQRDRVGWLAGSSVLQWGAGYFFVVAAGWFVGVAALGALRLTQYLFGLLNLLFQAIENYVLPKASAFIGDQNAYWWQLLKKCLLLIVPFLLLFSFFAKPILQLAGGIELRQYSFIVYGLSLVYLLMTIGYPVRIAIRSLQLNREYFIAYILSVFLNLCIAPWLLRHWELYGVLTGLFLNQLVIIGYWLIVLKRKQQFLWKSFI